MGTITHSVVVTGTNDPQKQVSKDAWNDGHEFDLAIADITGLQTALGAKQDTGDYVTSDSLASALSSYVTTSALSPLLAAKAPLASPTLTGTPAAPTAAAATNTTQIATTAFVQTELGGRQPLDADLTSWAGVTRAAGFDTFVTTPSSANFAALVTGETGSGALVFGTSPTLVTPALGTPSSGNLANCTFPTLNQNTTGSAASLTTARNIDGQAFNGTANITVIAPGTNAASSKATPVDADEMPLVDSAASNVLKKLTWANLKATLKTYLDTLYAPLTPKSARVYNNANISITTGTLTALTFNTERWDNDTIHSTGSNTSRLTATTAGLYQIGGTVAFAASAAGSTRTVYIRLNAVLLIAVQSAHPVQGGVIGTTLSITTQYSLAATDYVELLVFQDSGGALNALADGNYSPEFFMTRIGPQP